MSARSTLTRSTRRRLARHVDAPVEYRVLAPLSSRSRLRLQEAQRQMPSDDLDAAEAGYRVGHDDAAHFSREYTRHAGEPPMRTVGRMRERATAE
jgi:transcriptional regulator GlxA family with amidase domain